ncbi:hypothetical protein KC340_g17049 [Hortaea werneckii]|nr:hypothetical protein KC342_g17358 [Hortaea werneckii]KAI7058327.1 hypothetical protein KC339_g17662 [Hortaea werneckii]KAI7208146.1 hypothetical protein KC365_g16208 [Hortaea werneckii]KAI7291520.1 hypothetical protein KC340_g17049 [Hortaea werneckii]KAI7375557.1 hypothetical protein KC328_g15365 [Hortaea werneckii]
MLLPLLAAALAVASPVDLEAGADMANVDLEARAEETYADLEPRAKRGSQKILWFPHRCGNFKAASQTAAVQLLNQLYARPKNNLVCRNNGPGKCAPFLSNFGATLGLCNDNSFSKCVANRELADRTAALIGRCGNGGTVSGQIFADDRTNIIIRA